MSIRRSPSDVDLRSRIDARGVATETEVGVRELVGAYACDILSPREERRLHEAALDDQDLFDALAEESLLREAFADEAFRQRLLCRLRVLEEGFPRRVAAGLAALFGQPSTLLAVGTAAIGIVAGFGGLFRALQPPSPDSSSRAASQPIEERELPSDFRSFNFFGGHEHSVQLGRLWNSVRPGSVTGVELRLNRQGIPPHYTRGEPMRVGFSVPKEAAVVMLSKSPEGVVTQLFPDERRSSPLVRANERVTVPSAGQGDSWLAGPIGRHRLRLLVFAPGADPFKAEPAGQVRPMAVERLFSVLAHPSAGD